MYDSREKCKPAVNITCQKAERQNMYNSGIYSYINVLNKEAEVNISTVKTINLALFKAQKKINLLLIKYI